MTILVGLIVLCGALAIAAERPAARHPAFYVLKPLATLLVIGVAILSVARGTGGAYAALVIAGLALSLGGDVCLMFEGDRGFVAGLGSFLLAHIAFLAAFLWHLPALRMPLWSLALPVAAGAFFAWLLPRTGRLWIAVTLYCAVLVAMALAAVARHQVVPTPASTLAMTGALVFLLSDASLAVRRFGQAYRFDQALILSTYWLAVTLIALSV